MSDPIVSRWGTGSARHTSKALQVSTHPSPPASRPSWRCFASRVTIDSTGELSGGRSRRRRPAGAHDAAGRDRSRGRTARAGAAPRRSRGAGDAGHRDRRPPRLRGAEGLRRRLRRADLRPRARPHRLPARAGGRRRRRPPRPRRAGLRAGQGLDAAAAVRPRPAVPGVGAGRLRRRPRRLRRHWSASPTSSRRPAAATTAAACGWSTTWPRRRRCWPARSSAA